jgi:hypothetical protein
LASSVCYFPAGSSTNQYDIPFPRKKLRGSSKRALLSTAAKKVTDEKLKKTTTMATRNNRTNRMNGLSIFHAPNVSKSTNVAKKIQKSEFFVTTMGHDNTTKCTIAQ